MTDETVSSVITLDIAPLTPSFRRVFETDKVKGAAKDLRKPDKPDLFPTASVPAKISNRRLEQSIPLSSTRNRLLHSSTWMLSEPQISTISRFFPRIPVLKSGNHFDPMNTGGRSRSNPRSLRRTPLTSSANLRPSIKPNGRQKARRAPSVKLRS